MLEDEIFIFDVGSECSCFAMAADGPDTEPEVFGATGNFGFFGLPEFFGGLENFFGDRDISEKSFLPPTEVASEVHVFGEEAHSLPVEVECERFFGCWVENRDLVSDFGFGIFHLSSGRKAMSVSVILSAAIAKFSSVISDQCQPFSTDLSSLTL